MGKKPKVDVPVLENLSVAEYGSFYTVRGAGGDLQEWVKGLGEMLESEGCGRPQKWFRTTGCAVNTYVGFGNRDPFKDDLTLLMFPLDGMDVGRLALFRLRAGDVWFDDMVTNMRVSR